MVLQDYRCSKCGFIEEDVCWATHRELKHTIDCLKCGKPSHIRYTKKPDYQCSLTLGQKIFGSSKAKQRWLNENNLIEGGDLVRGSRHYIPPGLDEPASVPHGTLEFDHMPTEKDLEAHTAKIMQRINQGDRSFHVKETMQS